MSSVEDGLDKTSLLKILIRELGDVVDLAAMSGCDALAQRLSDALIESKRLYIETLRENRLQYRHT